MFIELTDHLRCPAEHDEQFLVLLPELIEDRWVRAGDLGCPVCGRAFRVDDGIFESGEPPEERGTSALPADAVAALSGLGGPGGYLVLVGGAARHADQIAEHLPGIALVLVNPPADTPPVMLGSLLVAPSLPLKTSSMRAAILGPGFGSDPAWVEEAARVVLSGNRVVGEGEAPDHADLELAASADGCWVATRVRTRV